MTVRVTLPSHNAGNTAANVPEYVRPNSSAVATDVASVARAIARARRIVVVCGAGISVQSGIPDFRSTSGLFRTLKDENPKELLSSGKDLFDSSVFTMPERTALFYKMIAQLATLSADALPSPFHHFLKHLDERGKLLRLYTQNIDSLEEKAGLTCGVPVTAVPSKPKSKKENSAVLALAAASAAAASNDSSSNAGTPTPDVPPLAPVSTAFPRCVPLHGTLKSLLCLRCSHSIPLASEISTLAEGVSVLCPRCTEDGSVRQMEGKRHRGVGRMRPSVVLYGEEHRAGEGVGECVRRDLIGLGDPLPPTTAVSTPIAPSSPSSMTPALPATPPSSAPPSTTSQQHPLTSTSDSLPDAAPSTAPTTKKRKPRPPRQRPNPSAQPDLLIVAGSSLKVPGTKRIVREFAKAVHATSGLSPSGSTSSDTEDADGAAENEGGGEVDLEEKPPRTIYLNLDWPVPSRDWKDTFDVWIQGDVQDLVGQFEEALMDDGVDEEDSKSEAKTEKAHVKQENDVKPPAKRKPSASPTKKAKGAIASSFKVNDESDSKLGSNAKPRPRSRSSPTKRRSTTSTTTSTLSSEPTIAPSQFSPNAAPTASTAPSARPTRVRKRKSSASHPYVVEPSISDPSSSSTPSSSTSDPVPASETAQAMQRTESSSSAKRRKLSRPSSPPLGMAMGTGRRFVLPPLAKEEAEDSLAPPDPVDGRGGAGSRRRGRYDPIRDNISTSSSQTTSTPRSLHPHSHAADITHGPPSSYRPPSHTYFAYPNQSSLTLSPSQEEELEVARSLIALSLSRSGSDLSVGSGSGSGSGSGRALELGAESAGAVEGLGLRLHPAVDELQEVEVSTRKKQRLRYGASPTRTHTADHGRYVGQHQRRRSHSHAVPVVRGERAVDVL